MKRGYENLSLLYKRETVKTESSKEAHRMTKKKPIKRK